MNSLYPIKFKTRAQGDTVGRQCPAGSVLARRAKPGAAVGESWEINGMPGESSVVANGFLKGNTLEEITEIYMGDLVGDTVFDRFGTEFPC